MPVNSVTGIALSGISAATRTHRVSAGNVANLLTEDVRPFRARQVAGAGGEPRVEVEQAARPEPIDLAGEIVRSEIASTQARASLRVLDTHLDLIGSIIDITR
jgi:flagellar basal body rod protein FlgC